VRGGCGGENRARQACVVRPFDYPQMPAGRAKAQHDPSLSELHDGPITRYPSGRYHGNGRHRQTPTGPSKL
jgi:hypothetical protein